jgi:4-alpha-glucanotransferase
MSASLQRLAAEYGIAEEYHDVWGRRHRVSDAVLRAILAAMRVDAASEQSIAGALLALAQSRCRQCLPPMTVVRANARPWRVRVHLPLRFVRRALEWRVFDEDGVEHRCAVPHDVMQIPDDAPKPCVALELPLDVPLPNGYHAIELRADADRVATGTLAVAPHACYRPPALRAGGRAWGIALQLYGVRSARNWGIGDFTDLGAIVEQWGDAGVDFVGVNPLHALFAHNPAHASPYSPSSRLFLNVLYIDVEAVAEFAHCREAVERVASPAFQASLAALRDAPLVDYAGVAALKMPMLERLYAQARDDARTHATSRWSAFDAFKTAGGEALRRQALFDALQSHFFSRDPAVWGWPAWPEPYRDPAAPAITAFADEHAERIDFFAWLQWQADSQRAAVAARARRSGLAIGLYTDLAVSIDRGGADAWAHQHAYAMTASVGAPPDAFNVKGQDWGLPPMIPECLRDAGYVPFIETLRANMRNAGALRIDHVMGLLRLYWVPSGAAAADGAYVHYPLADLLGLLALESERHRCLVIGEDLGTVPDEVRAALAANDVLSYRVLLFERDGTGNFNAPSQYPEAALATTSTHDLPTLAGWWEGRDIALRASHGHLGPDADLQAQMAGRIDDRGRLLAALARAGLLPADTPLDPLAVPLLTPAIATALQMFLARTPSALLAVQPEDVLGVVEQANLPGTTFEHPNWRRKLPVALEQVAADGRLRALASSIASERSLNQA